MRGMSNYLIHIVAREYPTDKDKKTIYDSESEDDWNVLYIIILIYNIMLAYYPSNL